MGAPDRVDVWSSAGRRFVDDHYGSRRGRVRTHVLHQHLMAHLPPPPHPIIDVGGGAGHQSIPLARAGYDVTIVDPSPAMLERAAARIELEGAEVARRMQLVEASGEVAPAVLGDRPLGSVLCHGVLMYMDDPVRLIDSLCALTAVGGIVSIVAKNVRTLAVRPALSSDWAAALAAFDSDRQINGLGLETRGDDVDDCSAQLAACGVDPVAWFGVRLFTDGWTPERVPDDPEEVVLAVELEASRRDPYRQMSRLFHLVGRRSRPIVGAP